VGKASPDETTDMTTSHSTKPQSAGQVAGYSHLTKLQNPQQVIGYADEDVLRRFVKSIAGDRVVCGVPLSDDDAIAPATV
jgi:hypothetical protein